MLTALVVDTDALARRRTAGLLRLGGWHVREAADTRSALDESAALDLDLVVTAVDLAGQDGLALLRRMRDAGSRARFLAVADEPTDAVRTAAAAAGALAVLAAPVRADVLLDFLRSRTTGPAAQDSPTAIQEFDDLHEVDLDAELWDRLQEMYVHALPGRLSAIETHTRSGDSTAVASAAYTLAGTSGQLGHPEVASVCQAIAADARRGVLAHSRVVQLHALAGVS